MKIFRRLHSNPTREISVSGLAGFGQHARGTLTLFCGGDEELFQSAQPIFSSIAGQCLAKVPMPATAAAFEMKVTEFGQGKEEAFSAVITLMERLAGLETSDAAPLNRSVGWQRI